MTRQEKQITRILKSRGFTWLLVILALGASYMALSDAWPSRPQAASGLWLPSPDLWTDSPSLSWLLSAAISCGVGLMMVLVNRLFNLLRTVSVAFVGYFMVMQAATPYALTCFDGGELLALVVMVCMTLMFSIFQSYDVTRRVFLVFFLLAAGAVVDYGFALYVPLFFLACYQMRVFKLRNLLAGVVGLATPLWILWGFGVIHLSGLTLPAAPVPAEIFRRPEALPMSLSVVVTLVAGLYFGSANIIKVMALNARSRAFNGLLSSTGVFTGLLCIIDFSNIAFYVTLLNCCTAMQAGLYMRIYASRRAYVPLSVMLVAYGGCYILKSWLV